MTAPNRGLRFARPTMRAAIGWLAVLLTLALGRVITTSLPSPDDAGVRPFVTSAAAGQTAGLRSGDVAITDVVGAPRLANVGQEMVSPGLFVRVTYRYTARERPSELTSTSVEAANGWTYAAGLGDRTPLSCAPAAPGMPVICSFVVEMPPDRLVGARARFAAEEDAAYDSVGLLDLGITAEQVRSWQAATQPLTVADPYYEGRS